MTLSAEVDLVQIATQKMPRRRILQRLRVPIALMLAISLLYFANPSLTTVLIGTSIAFVGLLIRAWAAGYIRKNQQLAVTGPYAHTRNPLYFGTFLIGIGFTLASGVWWIALIFMVYFLLVYIPVMQAESDDLARLFGSDFQAYTASVPCFIPRILTKEATIASFNFKLYQKHREYRVIIGFTLAVAFLLARTQFFH